MTTTEGSGGVFTPARPGPTITGGSNRTILRQISETLRARHTTSGDNPEVPVTVDVAVDVAVDAAVDAAADQDAPEQQETTTVERSGDTAESEGGTA